jgi:hypothetical protein
VVAGGESGRSLRTLARTHPLPLPVQGVHLALGFTQCPLVTREASWVRHNRPESNPHTLRLHGVIEGRTPGQSGTLADPPNPPTAQDYLGSGAPPLSIDSAVKSLRIRPTRRGVWQSTADAGWPDEPELGPMTIQPGTTIFVLENGTIVGFFHVESLD